MLGIEIVGLVILGVLLLLFFFFFPFLLCISSQMPNIAGFFGIFRFLYFRGIFSNLPVFSRAFPCNIGKSVGK